MYTEAEETDFDHLQGLAGYTDQVTKKVAQAVCQADNTCVLKSLPGAPSCNLAYLEESVEDDEQLYITTLLDFIFYSCIAYLWFIILVGLNIL